jgi:serine protease inhibitor
MRTVLSVAFALAGLTPAFAVEPEKNPAAVASNDFAFDLYKKLDAENRGKNVFFSPYSISAALAMTFEGARGATALEMGETLRLPAGLRQNTPARPWLNRPYNLGFGEIQRQLASGADPAKVEDVRKQLAALRKQLADNDEAVQKTKGDFRLLGELRQKSSKLTASISALSSQIDQFELRVANALFGEKTYPFAKDFSAAIDTYFGSGLLREADFRNNFPAERLKINRWVEEQTNDRIKDLVPALPAELAARIRLILVNAIYFKGEWSQPFDEKATTTEDFLSAGGKTPTKMMHLVNKDARYAAFNADGTFYNTPPSVPFDRKIETSPGAGGFHIAEIPVKGDRLTMVVIAPLNVDGLPAIEAKLSGETVTGWLAKLQKRSVDIALPRFKMETDYGLVDPLKALGMKKAFEERVADFSGMTTSTDPNDSLSISKVLHKAFIEVNEKGAEAAAATAVIMIAPTSIALNRPYIPEFRGDRPFLFMIRDRDSGVILFLGRMSQP